MIAIDLYLTTEREKINAALSHFLPQSGPTAVIEAMRYSLEAGGKRLRPILTIAVADTLCKEGGSILDIACALEFIHTYSLIHDDLPAMDNSDLRRGKPTCHRVYGEAVAILAGDALLTLAFEIIAAYGIREKRPEQALKIIDLLGKSSGVNGMIGGQILDLEAEGSDPQISDLDQIAALKTGALLKAAVLCGAIAVGAEDYELKALSGYADNIGPAFQIVDDLLDYEGTDEELGKPAGADLIRAKATYPALLGRDEARKQADLLHAKALESLNSLNRPAEILVELARVMVCRKS